MLATQQLDQQQPAVTTLFAASLAETAACCTTCFHPCRWDEQNALLVESHERVIAELAEEAEAKLAEEVLAAEALRQEKEGLEKEAAEVGVEGGAARCFKLYCCNLS